MDPVDERAGLLAKAGSFYYKILAEDEIKKAQRLAHLTSNCRAFRQAVNASSAVLSGGYFDDNWKVIRFKDEQILYYGADKALQKRYRIPQQDGAAISRPGFLTVRRHFLPAVGAGTASLQYGLDFNNTSNMLAVAGKGKTAVASTGGFLNYSTTEEYAPGTTTPNSNYVPPSIQGGASAHCPNGGTYIIGDGVNPIDGLNFETGFSIGMHLYNKSDPIWKDIFTIQINDTTLKVELGSLRKWVLYDTNSSNLLGLDGTPLGPADVAVWHHLGLTFRGHTMQVFYDGVLASEVALPDQAYKVTRLRGTSTTHTPGGNSLYIDNLAIYSGVLDAYSFRQLSTNPFQSEYGNESGLAARHYPLLLPGDGVDVVLADNTQMLYGLLVPKSLYVTSIELEDGKLLFNGVDFQSQYGLINFNENPVKVLGGMKFMARTYTERRRNIYSYTLGLDDVYGPVDRVVEYYRRNQSVASLYMAAAQATGMPVVREASTILGVMSLHGGKAYMTTSGRYDAPFPHNYLAAGEVLPAGYVIGGEDLFQMIGPGDALPDRLECVELRESCPVPGISVPNKEVQLFVGGVFQPAYTGKASALDAYWKYLRSMPAPAGDTPAYGNAMMFLLNNILAHKYIIVRVNEAVMPARMQLRLQEFLQCQRPIGSVLLYAPIERRILEE